MKKINIYFGPKKEFNKLIPKNNISLSEIVAQHDNQSKIHRHIVVQQDELQKDIPIEKRKYINVVAYSEQYAGITESAVQSFLSVLDSCEIDNLYLQNPPLQIKIQLQQAYPNIIKESSFVYKKLSKTMLFTIYEQFDTVIIGQEKVKNRLLAALYPLLKRQEKRKPIVIMFYGRSGIGKTETAKFISKILGQPLFRKQFSMFHSEEFQSYGDFLNGKSEYMPTLVDFRNELLRQPEDEAQDLALSLEIFTTGSLDAFAHQSDVNVYNRIVAYDILELGEQMKSIGLLIMLDNIFNRVMANRKRGKYTRVYVDEAHLYFKNPYSADFLLKCWKRFRKYGGLLTGITQNISDCLLNETARGMLSNSEFLLLLNQAPSDRKDLSELLSISDTQMSYITNAGAGRGLIKVGGSIVPFINDFPTDTELYKLMSTKLSE